MVSCTDNNFELPSKECYGLEITPTLTIAELKEKIQQKDPILKDDIIEAYVVSSDASGNFYKELYIQDNTGGMSLILDDYNLYTYYEIGRKIALELHDLHFEETHNQIQASNNGKSISKTLYPDIIQRTCGYKQDSELATKTTINKINDSLLGMLLEIDNVQFVTDAIGKTLYDSNNNLGGATNYMIEDNYGYNLIIRTSSFADFVNEIIPEGNGKINGILTKYQNDYQLLLRNYDDITFTENRQTWQTMSIEALRKKVQDTPLNENRYIEGIVTLSGYTGSPENNLAISERYAVIQDSTSGIALYFDANKHSLVEGDLVRIYIGRYNMDTYAGLLRLEVIDFDGKTTSGINSIEIISRSNTIPEAKKTTIDEVLQGKYQSEYIIINDIQFVSENRGLTFKGDKSVTDCSRTLNVYTRSASKYSQEVIPEGKGDIYGIVSTNSHMNLLLRSAKDSRFMTNPRCTEAGTLFFDENFESLTVSEINNSSLGNGWVTVSENSENNLWKINEYGENKYAQTTAYESGVEDMKVWLISPSINLENTIGEYLVFKTKDGYNNGNPLQVFISANFNGSDVLSADWELLSTKVANSSTFGYADLFTDSGGIDISKFSGNIYIGFKYSGSQKGITTTIQLDEVQVFGKKIN